MMTLMARLCTLCALTAMIQMALGENDAKGSMRMIGGLLMLHLTLEGARPMGGAVAGGEHGGHSGVHDEIGERQKKQRQDEDVENQ